MIEIYGKKAENLGMNVYSLSSLSPFVTYLAIPPPYPSEVILMASYRHTHTHRHTDRHAHTETRSNNKCTNYLAYIQHTYT